MKLQKSQFSDQESYSQLTEFLEMKHLMPLILLNFTKLKE